MEYSSLEMPCAPRTCECHGLSDELLVGVVELGVAVMAVVAHQSVPRSRAEVLRLAAPGRDSSSDRLGRKLISDAPVADQTQCADHDDARLMMHRYGDHP
jgi:hypothetical protein